MKRLVISVTLEDEDVAERCLEAAVGAVESLIQGKVYRAWVVSPAAESRPMELGSAERDEQLERLVEQFDTLNRMATKMVDDLRAAYRREDRVKELLKLILEPEEEELTAEDSREEIGRVAMLIRRGMEVARG